MIIPIAIVEDNNDIRQALEQIIYMADGFSLCCSCVNGEEALATIPHLDPKVVLMDINLGGINGIECVKILKVSNPTALFMMCTALEEDESIFQALKAGASGYILKKTTPPKLLEAIQELYEGGAPMSSQIARKVVAAFRSQITETDQLPNDRMVSFTMLSKREKEILETLAKGLLYKQIADQLGISKETVKKHVYSIYQKLHVDNRIEAVNKYFGR
jgi:DNA-binding NarL/FixJ family response regulator